MNKCNNMLTRRTLLRTSSLLALVTIGVPPLAAAIRRPVAVPAGIKPVSPPANRAPLAPQPFYLLPAGSIRPAGWLRRQMVLQAEGLGGRLDETWPDVGPNSGWLGGTGESWERGPYFLDGLLPLAWSLDDVTLKQKAQRFVDWTLSSQRADGMFGPATNDDWWPRMVMLKVLIQYHELTDDPRVIPLMTRYLAHQLDALPTRPLKDWGRFRWQDELVAVVWLYNRTGDEWLIRLANLLHEQGWDWRAEFEDFPFKTKITPEQIDLGTKASGDLVNTVKDRALSAHGVNNAMGIKSMPLWSLISHDEDDRQAVFNQLKVLDEYHGLPMGIFSADEHFAGRSPSQGVELCAVVETMYSLEQALAVTGDPAIADRIERIGYNALPGAFTDDMWSHQYDQQPNQIKSSLAAGPWTTNGPESNLFGLEPHFGCCTANFHQGWPKLLNSVWMASGDGGLAAMVYAPSDLATVVGNTPVRIATETDYPFRDIVTMRLSPERAVTFPLKLRVPAWATTAMVRLNGAVVPVTVEKGFATIRRRWSSGDRLDIAFAIETQAVPGFNNAVSVAHGPLLYVLPIGERWEKLQQRGLSADWQVFPTSDWNFGLPRNPVFVRVDRAVPRIPFSGKSPGALVKVLAARVPAWRAIGSFAAPPPIGPVVVSGAATERLTLVPYAGAKLRITEFPTVVG